MIHSRQGWCWSMCVNRMKDAEAVHLSVSASQQPSVPSAPPNDSELIPPWMQTESALYSAFPQSVMSVAGAHETHRTVRTSPHRLNTQAPCQSHTGLSKEPFQSAAEVCGNKIHQVTLSSSLGLLLVACWDNYSYNYSCSHVKIRSLVMENLQFNIKY